MDVLRALSTPNLDIRRKTLDIALDLIDARNIDEVSGGVGGRRWKAVQRLHAALHSPLSGTLSVPAACYDAPPLTPPLRCTAGGGRAEEGGNEDAEPGAGEGGGIPPDACAGQQQFRWPAPPTPGGPPMRYPCP